MIKVELSGFLVVWIKTKFFKCKNYKKNIHAYFLTYETCFDYKICLYIEVFTILKMTQVFKQLVPRGIPEEKSKSSHVSRQIRNRIKTRRESIA